MTDSFPFVWCCHRLLDLHGSPTMIAPFLVMNLAKPAPSRFRAEAFNATRNQTGPSKFLFLQ